MEHFHVESVTLKDVFQLNQKLYAAQVPIQRVKKTDGGREKVLNVSFSLHPMGQIQAQDTVCIFLLCFSLQLQLPLVNVHFPGPIET